MKEIGESGLFPPSEEFKQQAHISSIEEYQKLYKQSVEAPETFWGNIARGFYWKKEATDKFLSYNFDSTKGPIFVKWMDGALTNLCYNLLDRHVVSGLQDRVAYFWEGNEPYDRKSITYGELLKEVCKMSNALKKEGVKRGDRVAVYMPMAIETVVTMLACNRIGAVHSVIFGGFSAQSLADRIIDGNCQVVVTADGTFRGTKFIGLKAIVSEAISICFSEKHTLRRCIVHRHMKAISVHTEDSSIQNNQNNNLESVSIPWDPQMDIWMEQFVSKENDYCEPEWMDAEDPLFLLYTSGSTGKPKGVLHTIGGYMMFTATVFKYVFDYRSEDVFFCSADLGWITGHTFNVYGALANAATLIIFDGIPLHPDAGRFWQIVDRYRVSIFYTSPTAIRTLMKYGNEWVQKYERSSLRLLGSVGEPLDPEAWKWFHSTVGYGKCPISDTYWQSETGGPMLTPLPGCTVLKPGSVTLPFFGVVPVIVNDEGVEQKGEADGHLVFRQPWPGILRTVDGDHKRYESTYFDKFPGYYCTGDGCYRDKDGYYWISGRMDDMLNVSGHLLSTAEVESALAEHPWVSESAAVATPHPVKGESLYCFVVLKNGFEYSKELAHELKMQVRGKIGAFAVPDAIHPTAGLPKTRSGKVMRRILRKFVRNDRDLGDLSTLADPEVISQLYLTRATCQIY